MYAESNSFFLSFNIVEEEAKCESLSIWLALALVIIIVTKCVAAMIKLKIGLCIICVYATVCLKKVRNVKVICNKFL